jgi:hypothetical protein
VHPRRVKTPEAIAIRAYRSGKVPRPISYGEAGEIDFVRFFEETPWGPGRTRRVHDPVTDVEYLLPSHPVDDATGRPGRAA